MHFLTQSLRILGLWIVVMIFCGIDPHQGRAADPSNHPEEQSLKKKKKKRKEAIELIGQETGGPSSEIISTEANSPQKALSTFRFKIGFEFQMSGNLCQNVPAGGFAQKKPIFEFKNENGKKLWHVEIDGKDIEFVTVPFTDKEQDQLKTCLEKINDSCVILKDLLSENKKGISFDDWIKRLKEKRISVITISYAEDKKAKKALDVKTLKINPTKKFSFNPQVTIQHPLEHTIPLYFGLFGFDHVVDMSTLLSALPNYNSISSLVTRSFNDFKTLLNGSQDLKTKMAGLTFLHALTLVSMTPSSNMTDPMLLDELLNEFKNTSQIDPKRKMRFMSRRPFSSMLANIPITDKGTYSGFFKKFLTEGNKLFNEVRQVPQLLYLTNYGEQFFSPNGNAIDLSKFVIKSPTNTLKCSEIKMAPDSDHFNENVQELLKNGIISPAMLRLFKDSKTLKILSSPSEYYEAVLNTVENPKTKGRLNLSVDQDRKEITIARNQWNRDMLSPPWFLHENNAMGYMCEDNDIKEIDIQEYGEAIVEIRGIKRVGDWFQQRTGLHIPESSFLTVPADIEAHGSKLFEFLEQFENKAFVDDIDAGICYSIVNVLIQK